LEDSGKRMKKRFFTKLHFEVSVYGNVIVGIFCIRIGTKRYKFIHIQMHTN